MGSHNIQPLLSKHYLKAVSAKGIYIFDEHGKSYIDGSSGPIACSLGHTHPRMVAFMKKQLDKIQYVYRSQFGSEEAEMLAEKLSLISPKGVYSNTFFVNSGSEATETAIKVAIQYWREKGQPDKVQFIARQKSYHGITMGALSISGHQIRRYLFENTLLANPEKLKKDLETDPLDAHIREIEEIIGRSGPEKIAGLIFEPVIGAAGTALVPPEGYFQAIRQLCDEHQLLFLIDEVMTGLGRTGSWFGLDHWHTYADIVTIGKSLGAGYAPIAATLMTDRVIEPIRNGSGVIMSGHTYSGHPLSCATALQAVSIIEEDQLMDNVNRIGLILKKGLQNLGEKYAFIEKIRGKGLLLGMELDPAITGLQGKILDQCFNNGLLVYPAVGGLLGKDENGLLVAPPYIITEEETRTMLEILDHSFSQVAKTI